MDLRCRYSAELSLAVTGATGFLGRAVLAAAQTGFVEAGLEGLPSSTVVIHLAAAVDGSRQSLVQNITMDSWVAEFVEQRLAGLIYASGNNVYPLGREFTVDDARLCQGWYSASKVFGEDVVTMAVSSKARQIVRIADVFGQGQHHGNFFRAMERCIRTRSPLQLVGNGAKCRSYIHAPEAARYLLWAAAQMREGRRLPPVSNLCHTGAPTLADIVEAISMSAGLPVERLPAPGLERPDLRVMVPGPWGGYSLQRPSFPEALSDYIRSIQALVPSS